MGNTREEAPGVLIGIMIHDATNGKELVRKGIKFPLPEKKYKELLDHMDLLMSLAKGLLTLAGQAMSKFATTDLAQLKREAVKAAQEAAKGTKKPSVVTEGVILTPKPTLTGGFTSKPEVVEQEVIVADQVPDRVLKKEEPNADH